MKNQKNLERPKRITGEGKIQQQSEHSLITYIDERKENFFKCLHMVNEIMSNALDNMNNI